MGNIFHYILNINKNHIMQNRENRMDDKKNSDSDIWLAEKYAIVLKIYIFKVSFLFFTDLRFK